MSTAVEPVSPPPDFPVYGLDQAWQGPRWLDFFEAKQGAPAWALWLGHRAEDGSGGVRIGTLPRSRYDATFTPRGGDNLAPVAFSAAFGLVNLTLPDAAVQRPDGLIPALVEHAEQQAKRHAEWRRVTWDVEGTPVRAAVWRFAGAWAGFTDALGGTYLVAVGIEVQPEGLRLSRFPGSKEHGIDLDAPLDLVELGRQRHERPDTWLPPPRRDSFHPDQLAVLDRPSPTPRMP
ncbi:hypothetical protein [Amycolatopsis aidingensis]|uniref:hypothetical protein n=1 Tax=Amycolatopsis aidingensis TaxID=2842453 RepID=UPI001C0B6BB6|nr:hypothetical protein [Amycolatopsis aidingensis]